MEATPTTDELHLLLGRLADELETLKSTSEQIGESREAAGHSTTAAQQVVSTAKNLHEATSALVARIEAVDFPKRLDALQEEVRTTRSIMDMRHDEAASARRKIAEDHSAKIRRVADEIKEGLRMTADEAAKTRKAIEVESRTSAQRHRQQVSALGALGVVLLVVVILLLTGP